MDSIRKDKIKSFAELLLVYFPIINFFVFFYFFLTSIKWGGRGSLVFKENKKKN